MIRRKRTIGRVEKISFPKGGIFDVPAKIDTGAKTSAIWATDIKVASEVLSFVLLAPSSSFYTGKKISLTSFSETIVLSSNGISQKRFKVKLQVKLDGRKINAAFTLADRSRQMYPVLIGRNVLRGKFVVDVKLGNPTWDEEKEFSIKLQNSGKENK